MPKFSADAFKGPDRPGRLGDRLVYLHNAAVPSVAASTVQVMRMCSAFRASGHEVTLVAPQPEVEVSASQCCAEYGCQNAFPIVMLPPGIGKNLGFALRAARTARRLKADLVFGRCARSCAAAALLGMATIFEAHGPIESFSRSSRLALRAMFSRSRKFRHLVVINHALAEHYLEKFPALAGRIVIAPSGADAPLDHSGSGLHSNTRPRLGYIGSLHEGKGMELLAEIIAEMPECDFIVAGGSQAQIDRWSSALSGRSNITFLGHVANREVASLLTTFDIALAPYLPVVQGAGTNFNLARWMSPLKLFEYMASGKAIVTSDMPAIREVVDDGVHAELCNPLDPTDWVRKLRALAKDPARRRALEQAAYQRFLDRHQWQDRAVRVLAPTSSLKPA